MHPRNRCRIVIHIEGKHAHLLEGYMHPLASLLITELDDLRSFKHHSVSPHPPRMRHAVLTLLTSKHPQEVERLRSSPEWPGGRMKYNPAAMPLYNSLVMSKLYWLDEALPPSLPALHSRQHPAPIGLSPVF